jgi:hypothetical protein
MSVILFNATGLSKFVFKKVELVEFDGKHYIEVSEFENSDCVVELSIALAAENQALKERVEVLEERLRLLGETYNY